MDVLRPSSRLHQSDFSLRLYFSFSLKSTCCSDLNESSLLVYKTPWLYSKGKIFNSNFRLSEFYHFCLATNIYSFIEQQLYSRTVLSA